MDQPSTPAESLAKADEGSGLFLFAVLAVVVGGLAGLVATLFRKSLDLLDQQRNQLLAWAQPRGALGLLAVTAGAAAMTALAAFLVHRLAPRTAGSGIPDVEAVISGKIAPAHLVLLPVKFVGGVLAIGAGLALGREGPSVQMGGMIAGFLGSGLRRSWYETRALIAAGAAAGLATAFNAPIAGAVFVLDEILKRFETRTTIATLGASAGAIVVMRAILGPARDFHVPPFEEPALTTIPLYLLMGVFIGLAGVAYNRATIGTLSVADHLQHWPVEVRAGLVGAGVGVLGWFAPGLIGGGDDLTQRVLAGGVSLALLPGLFLLRFGLGAVSYAARTPGGLFAPMLVLGASLGQIAGLLFQMLWPEVRPDAFAVVGMAALFAAAVRAPVAGMVLVVEMTGSFELLLPMLGASFAAMVVPTLLRDAPIYDALRVRSVVIDTVPAPDAVKSTSEPPMPKG